jgi:predicted dehydrogenase
LIRLAFTTDVHEAKKFHDLVSKDATNSVFVGLNHTANYRRQAQVARQLIESGEIGEIRHVTAFMASALSWIFEDPANTGWNEPTKSMLGNGFAWGQSSHILAWIFHTCPTLRPHNVYCAMNHSPITGADVAHAATIRCSNETSHDVVLSLSGTSLLPGQAHSDPPVGKQIRLKIYGTKGAIIYSGDDHDPSSGRLELRRAPDGGVELPLGPDVGFEFENSDAEGTGPESLESFVQACRGSTDYYMGADTTTGLRSIQTIEAMYRSEHSKNSEKVEYS